MFLTFDVIFWSSEAVALLTFVFILITFFLFTTHGKIRIFRCFKFDNMSGRNQGNNSNNNTSAAVTAAAVAIGAAIGYGAYKLFGFGSNKPQQNQSNDDNKEKQEQLQNEFKSPPFSYHQKEIYVIDAIEKLQYSLKELKSYVDCNYSLLNQTKIFNFRFVDSLYL